MRTFVEKNEVMHLRGQGLELVIVPDDSISRRRWRGDCNPAELIHDIARRSLGLHHRRAPGNAIGVCAVGEGEGHRRWRYDYQPSDA